jgi:hypothetical protein
MLVRDDAGARTSAPAERMPANKEATYSIEKEQNEGNEVAATIEQDAQAKDQPMLRAANTLLASGIGV